MSAGRGRGMPQQQQPQYNAMYQDIAQMSLQDPNIQLSNQLRQMLLSQENKNTHQAHNIMMNAPIMGPLGQQNPQSMYMPDNNWMMGQARPIRQVMPQGVTMSNMFNSMNNGQMRQGNGQYGQSYQAPQAQYRQPQQMMAQPQRMAQPGSRTGPMGPIKPGVFEQPVGAQITQSPQSAQTGPVGQSLFKSSPSNDMSGDEFLQSLMKGASSPQQQTNPASAVTPAVNTQNTSLSVSANEFVPCFRKPEKQIVLYTYESFKKKSKADDENAINDVKTKLVKLYNDPQDVAAIMEPSVNTVKSWTTSVTTYHQIVEDIFEFSIDEVNHPNFYHIGSKVLGYFTLNIPAYGTPPLTFFDAIIHKCCREYDNCLREDLALATRQGRARHVALMIAELFTTIKEGDLRVFVFAEQIVHLCHLLTQCPTNVTVDAVAKIMLVCGRDLKDLVDDDRFGSIINSLSIIIERMGTSLDSKTVTMVESVVKLNKAGWPWDESQNNNSEGGGGGGDTDAPVANAVDWNEYANDDFDDQWLNEMLRFEEEDDFSDVEEDFKKFMLDAAKNKS